MSGPDALQLAAEEFLAACIEAVETGSADAGAGVLGRSYVSPGVPSWDCSQLAVHVGTAVEADTAPLMPPLQPMRRVDQGRLLNLVSLVCTVIRCCVPVPTGEGQNVLYPTGEAIQAVAVQTNQDLWAIWNHLAQMKRAGDLFPPERREFRFDPAIPLPISGGCAGWQIQVAVELGGYNPSQHFEIGLDDSTGPIH